MARAPRRMLNLDADTYAQIESDAKRHSRSAAAQVRVMLVMYRAGIAGSSDGGEEAAEQ